MSEMLSLTDAADRMGIGVTGVKQLIKEHKLLAMQTDNGLAVPALVLDGELPVKHLIGCADAAARRRLHPGDGLRVADHRGRLAARHPAAGAAREPRHRGQAPRPGAASDAGHGQRRRSRPRTRYDDDGPDRGLGLVVGSVVVEHNGTALLRSEVRSAALSDGDVVELVRAVAGG